MMKKDMNLSLADASSSNLKPHLRDAESILNSPDVGLLKLASPELERLIIQSNGMVTTSPSQFLYPRSVSDEQEFAEGFVKALEDLHKQNQLNGLTLGAQTNTSLDLSSTNVITPVTLHPDLPVYTNLNSYGNGPLGTSVGPLGTSVVGHLGTSVGPLGTSVGHLGTTVNYSTDTVPFPPPPPHHLGGTTTQAHAHSRLQQLKDEPQTVPDVQSFGDSPPLSPINMDTQERIKAERKKLRNRIAASKCRKRKLERISRLEDKVKGLKTQNSDLASTASALREQVAQLKQKVLNHVNSGCQLLPQVQVY